MDTVTPLYANYLPDELLLEILSYIPRDRDNQSVIGTFCAVSRYVDSFFPELQPRVWQTQLYEETYISASELN